MKHIKAFITILAFYCSFIASAKDNVELAPSFAWSVLQPLGLREPATIDTTFLNYSIKSIPSLVTPAWATTGNLGDPGINLIFSERKPVSEFFFVDGLWPWIPTLDKIKFYNTRIPMTLLSYNFGGGSATGQDRLQATFSGNVNKQLQFGAITDYLYSKGMYDNQAVKNFTWGFNGSYIGDKFEVQFYQYHYNLTNRESGGIENDLYITDPAEIQGGNNTISPKSIPTNLTQAQNRTKGSNIFLNAKYKLGFWKEVELEDSSIVDEYVPVTAIIWTMNWNEGKHKFKNVNATQGAEFWENRYLLDDGTDDLTKYSSFRNTFGISLLEGFNRFAKFGLSAYAAIDLKSYTQSPDSMLYMPSAERPAGLSEYTGIIPPSRKNFVDVSIGAQLTKQQGSLLNYEGTVELGMTGRTAGDLKINGIVSTKFPFLKDSLSISAFARWSNTTAPYFLEKFISNHFIWDNDFNQIKRFMFGGEISFPRSMTKIRGEIENLNDYVYFNSSSLPSQHKGNVQVISLIIKQNFAWRALHLDNSIYLQKSTNHNVIPVPKFTIYSNLYCLFKIAKVLDIQIGVDIDYYTSHLAVNYQPATMAFFNDPGLKVGGFPFMNAYANMKLGKTHFYVMYSHINTMLFGKPNYFSIPHYPLNPAKFQLGLSVDFAN